MIVDTETHVFYFTRNSRVNPDVSMTKHCTWHEHSGDLLVAEMDRAGVDKAFVISYDAEDILWWLRRNGLGVEDFSGGKKYTLHEVRRYPERLIWVTTLKDPRRYDACEIVRQDAANGARAIKVFPAYFQANLTEPAMLDVYRTCLSLGLQVMIAFEDIVPPETYSLEQYLEQLEEAVSQFPELNFGLMHAGCADPLTPAARPVFRITREHDNLFLGTAKAGNLWDDGSEYPYRNLLKRIEVLAKEVGAAKIMYATDWPWYDDQFLYEQGLNAFRRHAPFLSTEEKADFLGRTAMRFLKQPVD